MVKQQAQAAARRMKGRLKTAFWRGMAALLPTALTVGILLFAYNFVAQNIGRPINEAIKFQLRSTNWGEWVLVHWFGWTRNGIGQLAGDFPSWVGVFIALFLVMAVGLFFTSFVGRKVWRLAEEKVAALPIVKIVYPYAKQITEFFFKERQTTFSSVVALEYPRKGIWSIGFLTGTGLRSVSKAAGKGLVNVFIPSSPTPITGYVIFVAVEDLSFLDLTVDEAIRFAVSGGVLIPDRQSQEQEMVKVLPSGRVPVVDADTRKLFRKIAEGPGAGTEVRDTEVE